MRVIVVGSGLAGLEAALTAAERGCDVVVLTKGAIADSATAWAQGGIAAAIADDDTSALHAADTMRASAGLAEPRAVDVLVTEGPEIVHELAERGVHFDRDDRGQLARGREAAHSLARVVHAGGDSTGAEIERALVDQLRDHHIEVHEHLAVSDLVVAGGRVVGVATIDQAGQRQTWPADAVVLATGGAGQVYRYTTNPTVATGDGLAAAMRAGAQVADLEFVQFHPTALVGERIALVSEAVRGEGAVLRNSAGERFMLTVHPDAELAPRDVVARAVAREMARDTQPVWLDATALRPKAENAAFLAERFPSIDAMCHEAGIDWATEWVPITPAAHYLMGGIETDLNGRTSVPGLWAVGEVARTGVHGANRLASNSLLEAAVFGRRAGVDVASQASIDTRFDSAHAPLNEHTGVIRSLSAVSTANEVAAQHSFDRADLQQLMWTHAGLERNATGLRAAAAKIAEWRANFDDVASIRELEDRNLLDVSAAIVDAALTRDESVGAHFRTDDVSTGAIDARSLSEARNA